MQRLNIVGDCKMNTVITHFYNEEYLLPWWIKHHRRLFDYGIMINYHSTDRSLEICKELCPPHWKIVNSINENFDAEKCDMEVKFHENSVEGFKIALTTTEFFLTPISLNNLNDYMKHFNVQCIKTIGVRMVDMYSDELPSYDYPLFFQKYHGVIEDCPTIYGWNENFKLVYGRFYHNQPFGKYTPGRHMVHDMIHSGVTNVFTLKYKYSPWNENLKKRMLQIGERVPQSDLNQGRGNTHLVSLEDIDKNHIHYSQYAYDLRTDISFLNAHNYCMSYI
jgi:hypothetical protein